MNETCENCRYSSKSGFSSVVCKRYPPKSSTYSGGYHQPGWVELREIEWCGEWKAKTAQTVDRRKE